MRHVLDCQLEGIKRKLDVLAHIFLGKMKNTHLIQGVMQ
jgi:hypothetical protein